MRATGRLPALAFAALIFGTASAAMAAELVVVEARGVGLKQGDVIDDAKPLTLKDGQLVTLVAENGSILTLRGPYDQAPSASSGGVDVASAIGALTTGKAQNVAGVVRSASTDVHLPSPWLVDVSHPGVACLRGGEQPVLWRASDAGGGTLTMVPADRSWRAQTQWPAGSPTLQTKTVIGGASPPRLTRRTSQPGVPDPGHVMKSRRGSAPVSACVGSEPSVVTLVDSAVRPGWAATAAARTSAGDWWAGSCVPRATNGTGKPSGPT